MSDYYQSQLNTSSRLLSEANITIASQAREIERLMALTTDTIYVPFEDYSRVLEESKTLRSQLSAAEAREKALRRYVKHEPTCTYDASAMTPETYLPCSCGLDAAPAPAAVAAPQGDGACDECYGSGWISPATETDSIPCPKGCPDRKRTPNAPKGGDV